MPWHRIYTTAVASVRPISESPGELYIIHHTTVLLQGSNTISLEGGPDITAYSPSPAMFATPKTRQA